MESKQELVTRPMLHEKHKRFEELLQVPEEECLLGEGWVLPFCKVYNIKEHQQHGEAGSVDVEATEAERKHLQDLTKKYAAKNHFNFNETSLFPR